ncbi:MAG TPA: ParB/RepB/Spo0J family partition protein [Pyrinomonadaceae bacterium]|jgi:ParB family chromosome partitioning protein|nr:ParB/RepB/Spo0J family partition protein [Pyrinomonadaceae bacterium]
MRHDAHYVEELASQTPASIGRLITIELLDPNPDQPRVEIGDLTELILSVRERGVLEPLLVTSSNVKGRWMIIAGERRWRAAKAAGLREVPCIELEVDEQGVAEIALIENMQRKDLTPWEEADGLAALCHRYGYTHEEAAKKVGKSRSTVTEALSLAAIPEEIREECRIADITVKSLLLQVVRQPDFSSMRQMIKDIAGKGLTRDEVRAAKRTRQVVDGNARNRGGTNPYVFKYDLPEVGMKAEIRFEKPLADGSEIISALKTLIACLEKEKLQQ